MADKTIEKLTTKETYIDGMKCRENKISFMSADYERLVLQRQDYCVSLNDTLKTIQQLLVKTFPVMVFLSTILSGRALFKTLKKSLVLALILE